MNSNPDITLTEPAQCGDSHHGGGVPRRKTESIYIDSGRGYTRKGRLKPDLAAPGVDVAAFGPGDVLTALTGTSAAAAVTAGAAAR